MSDFFHPLDVLADPAGAASAARGYGCTISADVASATNQLVVLALELRPYPELAAAGYPDERLRIAIWRDGEIVAIPQDTGRTWSHRNGSALGELCLWYEKDPRSLRWEWSDGLLSYIAIAHRHLLAEEFARRDPDGRWPVEDAPHGDAANGSAHPIKTLRMRFAAAADGSR